MVWCEVNFEYISLSLSLFRVLELVVNLVGKLVSGVGIRYDG